MRSVDTGISYYVPEDRPRIAEAFRRCVRDGTPFNEELQLVRQSDGELRWVNAIGRAEHDDRGDVVVVHGALQDITDRIEAQVAAETHRRRLETLGASMPFVIWTAQADGALDYLSEEFWRATGILPADALGDAWVAALHPDDRNRALAVWERAVATGEPYLTEFRVRTVHGGHRWHYVRATPERNAAGDVLRWWGSSIDIHDMHVLQDEATALAAQLSDTLESIGDAVLSLDTEWRVTFVNTQGERLLQHDRAALVGRNIWMVFPEAIGSVFQQEYERAVAERRPVTFGAPFAPLDIYAEVSAYPHDGGLTIYFRDVSGHRTLTEAGAVVHESADAGNKETTD
jgi:PAS domain S-box-containing protein